MKINSLLWIAVSFALSFFCLDANAGQSVPIYVGYSPHPASIPSLSSPSLIALVFLVAVLMHRTMREWGHSKLFSAVTLGATFLLGVASLKGLNLIRSADAVDSLCPISLTLAGGGTGQGTINSNYPASCTVTNNSGVSQDINSITPPSGTFEIPSTTNPRCVPGSTTLTAGGVCYIRINTG